MRALKQWIDRKAIDLATKLVGPVRDRPARDEEAVALLNDPAFLLPPTRPAEMKIEADGSFSFPSTAPSRARASNTVHGRFFRVSHRSPTVVLAHGWNAELHYAHGFPRLARGLNRRNLNAIAFELPYHMRRRPGRMEEVRDFISDDLSGMLLATRQAIADIEALLLWLRQVGCEHSAVWGFSLGAWLAGLHATQSATTKAVALTTPVSNLKLAVETLPFCFPIRAALKRTPVPIERLNLTQFKPRVPPDRILLTEALHDLFVPSETYLELAEQWRLPGWQKVRQSHISILLSPRSLGSIMDWLKENLAP